MNPEKKPKDDLSYIFANMKKTINHYNLYGEQIQTLLPDFVHCETIESRSKAYNWEIKPHIHSQLYQIFLMETGEGFVILDKKEVPFKAPCIITMPSNNLHGFRYNMPTDGRVLTLSEVFLEQLFDTSPKVALALNQIRLVPISTDLINFENLIRTVDAIDKELFEDFSEKKIALRAYLSLFFVEVFRLTKQREQGMTSDNRQLQYFRDFQKSIKKSLSAIKTVTEYAQELNITSVHLNRICQNVAQKSASQFAQEYIIAEAQKYLAHTSYTITEISYLLDFNDPAYFSRVFKKETGVSPKIYRQTEVYELRE
ncbi:MAG: helix-turn-helix domain-containing protein [Saprospiraceae bacterium]|nr:helix-turn-helix domain-containing protein [Saprospiraceae bacterium]